MGLFSGLFGGNASNSQEEVQAIIEQLGAEGLERIDIVDISERSSLDFLEIDQALKDLGYTEGNITLS